VTEAEAFKLLGLKPGADSPETVRKRYHDLAWEAHPDLGGKPGVFARLGEAKTVALVVAYAWPCEKCRGTGKLSLKGSFGAAATINCGHCGGTGKKW
jgi:DnaJ-class molecular chaperone